MGFFDFLKQGGKKATDANDANFSQLLTDIAKEANEKKKSSYSQFNAYGSLTTFDRLRNESNDFRRRFLFYVFEFLLRQNKSTGNYWDDPWYHAIRLVSHLLKITPLQEEDLTKVAHFIRAYRSKNLYSYFFPDLVIVEAVQDFVRQHGLTPMAAKSLRVMFQQVNEYSSAETRKANELILFLLQEDSSLEIAEHDRWGKGVISYLKNAGPAKDAWVSLFIHVKTQGSKSTPTQKWLKEAGPYLDKIGLDLFSVKMEEWLSMVKGLLQEIHKAKSGRFDFLRDENHDVLKGLIWCCGIMNTPSLLTLLDEYAAWAYKKLPGVGPVSAKTGTAAMYAFSLLPVKEGVSRLSKFRMKIKNNTILKSINKLIKEVADKNEIPLNAIEELSVPDYGIQNNEYALGLGNGRIVYNMVTDEIKWSANGKIQKTVPADIKETYKSELKTFKNTVKEISDLLPVIKNRLEQSYLLQRKWKFSEWKSLYIDHPISSLIATKLVWHFISGDRSTQGIYHEGAIIDVKGQPLDWIADAEVQLWHPIGFTTDDIVAWRVFLRQHNIIQPFKQAYREVYILTDAELRTENYSNRFAAHVLRQHQFAALCRQRGWQYHLMGNWDSHNTPSVVLPGWNIMAYFYVNAEWNEAEGNTNAMGIFNYITTDQVRFLRDGGPVSLMDVPAMVFSEVMRDVDLFVGVTSIGNDPAWQDGGDNYQNTYWREYSFSDLSESAKIRSQVLESLIPNLKIAPQCSFDKKFLIVKGNLRTYKIHMGSGNILMEPDDQYLCIVPDGQKSTKEKVYLPFEGDGLLSIILSKAFLLAADDKITDVTITRQIKR